MLLLAIFPLIASLGLALSNVQLAQGGFTIKFIGLANFTTLLTRRRPERLPRAVQAADAPRLGAVRGGGAVMAYLLVRYLRSGAVLDRGTHRPGRSD